MQPVIALRTQVGTWVSGAEHDPPLAPSKHAQLLLSALKQQTPPFDGMAHASWGAAVLPPVEVPQAQVTPLLPPVWS